MLGQIAGPLVCLILLLPVVVAIIPPTRRWANQFAEAKRLSNEDKALRQRERCQAADLADATRDERIRAKNAELRAAQVRSDADAADAAELLKMTLPERARAEVELLNARTAVEMAAIANGVPRFDNALLAAVKQILSRYDREMERRVSRGQPSVPPTEWEPALGVLLRVVPPGVAEEEGLTRSEPPHH